MKRKTSDLISSPEHQEPKKPNTTDTLDSYLVTLEDVPNDCLRQIFRLFFFDISRQALSELITVSKSFYKITQVLLSEMLLFLSNSEVGKQIPLKTDHLTWEYFFQTFDGFSRIQLKQWKFLKSKDKSANKFNYGSHFILAESLNTFKSQNEKLASVNDFILEGYYSSLRDKETLKIQFDFFSTFPLIRFDMKKSLNIDWGCILTIHFSSSKIVGLPSEIQCCYSLQDIQVYSCNLIYIPPELGQCQHLVRITISKNKIKEFPKELSKLRKIEILNFSQNQIKSLPRELGELKSLKKVNFSKNKIEVLPEEIGKWNNITDVDFSNNEIEAFPPTINNWKKIISFDGSLNILEKFPKTQNWKEIKKLNLSKNYLKKISKKIENCCRLESLDLQANEISFIHQNLGILFEKKKRKRQLLTRVAGNCRHLSALDFSENLIEELPSSLLNCKNLSYLNIGKNNFQKIPQILKQMRTLNMLHIEGIKVEKEQLSELCFIQEIMMTEEMDSDD